VIAGKCSMPSAPISILPQRWPLGYGTNALYQIGQQRLQKRLGRLRHGQQVDTLVSLGCPLRWRDEHLVALPLAQ